MSCWQIREVRELGKEGPGRLFTLSKDRPLTIGQADDSVLQLKLRSIERRHAAIEWNDRKCSYIIRDVGTPSGTYINNAPLTRDTDELRHGDSLRFGLEKSHVFRVEENFHPVKPSVVTMTTTTVYLAPTTAATQTSPQRQAVVDPTHCFAPTSSSPLAPALTTLLPQGIVFPGGYFMSPGGHQGGTIMSPGGQQGGTIMTPGGPIPYLLPQGPGYIQAMNSPHIQGSTQPPYAQPPYTQPPYTQPPYTLPPYTQPPSSVQSYDTNRLSVQDIEVESPLDDIPTSPKRSDGRRQTELTTSRAATSRLYGQPAWWGEDGRPHPPTDNEYKPVQHGPQTLRDFDSDDASSISSRSSKLSVKDELRLKAISNSHDQQSPNSAWVLDFTPSSKPHPHSKLRPRSADHSPVRTPPVINNNVSSTTSLSRKKQSTFVKHKTPISTKEVANKAVTKRPRGTTSSLTRSATTRRTTPQTLLTSTLDSKSRRKSGSLSDITSKTAENKSDVKQASLDPKTRKKSGSLSNIAASKTAGKSGTKNESGSKGIDSKTRKKSGSTSDITGKSQHSMVDKTYTKIGGQGSSDELQTSMSDLSLASSAEPVIVGEGLKSASSEGCEACGEGGSARKKWSKEQEQTPDISLMLANIEARMRQLSRLAQGSAVKLTATKRDLQERGVVSRDDTPHIVPFSPGEQRVPQWKFSQTKEVHSIFRSVKSVEKWLNDIDLTLASMHLLPKEGGVAANEEVDYDPNESEVECYHDSIEDNFASCSESNYSD